MTRQIYCTKLKKETEGLAFAPYHGEIGKKIYESISKEAWQEWLKRQVMLINEYRLNLADAKSQELLEKEMISFLFDDGGTVPEGYREKKI